MSACADCGIDYDIGDWPFCPHGKAGNGVVTDEIPGGVWVENIGPEPVKVYSHSERRRLAAANGLEECIRHIPGSPVTQSWSTIDAQTMRNAEVLASRQSRSRSDGVDPSVEDWKATLKDTHERLRSSRFESIITRGGSVSAEQL